MGFVTKDPRGNEEQPGGGSGLHLDLDERVCPVCRRDLLPWQLTCPDDGAAATMRSDLPPLDVPPAHLLADDPAFEDPADDAADIGGDAGGDAEVGPPDTA